MLYHFRIHHDDDGFWAECLELHGCSTQADTKEKLLKNAMEALNLYLEEPEDSSLSFPLPQENDAPDVIAVPVDPRIALSILLRKYREDHHYTQKEVAEKLGMKNTYSYQRLERRSNPNLATLRKLKNVFPDLSVDYVLQD